MNEKIITTFINKLCKMNPFDFSVGISDDLKKSGIKEAVRNGSSKKIFNWLMGGLSYQGTSDKIVEKYIEEHGNITYRQITTSLNKTKKKCHKLNDFDSFKSCGFKKNKKSCKNQRMYNSCPLPKHDLRKGQLNQMAYSLYFFIRDVCNGDLVGFINESLARHEDIFEMRDELISELIKIYGVSYKILNMMISGLLMGADRRKSKWIAVGQSMIVIDTLVHNILHRTGILKYYDVSHKYNGAKCYRNDGCIKVIDNISKLIDCRKFNSDYPRYFPRFIQHSLWHYCCESGDNICNGNAIDDDYPCENESCFFYSKCEKISLNG